VLNLSQSKFINRRQNDWQVLENLIAKLKRKNHSKLSTEEIASIASLFRKTCTDLSKAQTSGYGSELIGYLNSLVARTHNELYRPSPYRFRQFIEFYTRIFPQIFRKNILFFIISTCLFIIPLISGIIVVFVDENIAYSIVPENILHQMEAGYKEGFSEARSHSQNSMMASFYISNNVGIAFQCFATGIFYGLGTIYYLIYNGIFIGVVSGYVALKGATGNFIAFVVTHSAFEITAIFISGAAGLKMGYSLIKTNGLSRLESLKINSKEIIILVLGAASFLLIAAFIEGFWSPSTAPNTLKYITGIITLSIVTLYLSLVGRKKNEHR